jgi:hypothetical protein
MATRNTVTDQYVLTTRIDNQMAAGEQAAVRSLDRIEQAAQRTAEGIKSTGDAIGGAGGRIIEAGSSFDRYAGKLDGVTQAQNRLTAAQNELTRVQAAFTRANVDGSADADAYQRTIATLGTRITTLAQRLGEARAAALADEEATRRWNATAAEGADAVSRYASEIAAAAQANRAAMAIGQQHSTVLAAVGKSSSAAAFAVRDLGLQSIDLFQGIATGQPIMRTFIQQAGQTVQVATAMNVSMGELAQGVGSSLASAFRAVVSPIGLAVTGFGALAGAAALVLSHASDLADEQRQLSIALTATGRSADVSAASLQKYVSSLRDAGVSAADARAIGNSLGRNQNLSDSEIGAITTLTPDLATALGTDAKSAASQLASIASGSSDALAKLNDQLHFLSAAQEAAARSAIDHNDKLGAMQAVVDGLTARIQGLHDQALSPAARVLQELSNSWRHLIDGIAESGPALRLMQGMANAMDDIASAFGNASISRLTGQLADLQGQAAKISTDLGQIPEALRNTDVGKDLQHQLDAVTAQIDSVQKAIDATTAKANRLPTLTVGPSQEQQHALDVERLAQTRAESSTAGQAARYKQEISDFRAELEKLGPKTAENSTLFDRLTQAIGADQKALSDLNKKGQEHVDNLTKQKSTLDAQIAAQKDLAAAYGQGAGAVDAVLAKQHAEQQAVSDGLIPGTAKYAAAVADLTEKQLALAQATAQADYAKQLQGLKDAAAGAEQVAAAYDGSAESITHAQNQIRAAADAAKAYSQGSPEFANAVADEAAQLDRSAAAMAKLNQEQASVQGVTNIASQAFDQVGEAIVNAFVSGQGAAVNFGNVLRGVVSSVLQQVAQLAIINPIINGLFGGARPTLASGLGVLGGVPVEGGGLGIASNLSALGRLFTGNSLSAGIDAFGANNLPFLFGPSTSNATLLTSDLGGITAGTAGVQGGGGLLSGLGPFSSFSNVLGVLGAALPGLLSGNYRQAAFGTVGAGAGLAAGSALGSALGIGLGPAGLPAGKIVVWGSIFSNQAEEGAE